MGRATHPTGVGTKAKQYVEINEVDHHLAGTCGSAFVRALTRACSLVTLDYISNLYRRNATITRTERRESD